MGMKTPQVVLDRLREDFTRAMAVIDELHVAGHLGAVFSLDRKLSIPAGSVVWMIGTTNGNSIHFVSSTYSVDEGGLEVQLREGVEYSGGTEMPPVCRNRALNAASTFSLVEGATVSDSGVQLSLNPGLPRSSSFITRTSLEGQDSLEWQLAPSQTYGLRLENLTPSSRTVYAHFVWYEPELMNGG